jgi:uncharacterized protein YcgI (DUF1989 family)
MACRLERRQTLRIEDVEGQQVSDLVAFLAEDITERFSQANTRKLNNSWLISVGAVLYSTKCRPLLTIVEDTVGRHDMQSSACSPYDYPIRFGVTDHPSCLAILRDQLEPLEIPEHLIPDPFNVFMNTSVDGGTGEITVEAARSRSGDHIVFEALEACVVALTVCPQDQNECNGRRITPLSVTVT